MTKQVVLGVLAGLSVLAAPLLGQGTISDGDVQFVRGASAFDGTPGADLKGVSANATQDHVFEAGWWFRLSGETQESPLGTPASEVYAGNTSTITWTGVHGAFDAQEVTTVLDAGSPGNPADGGYVTMVLTITNPSASQVLSMHLFHYLDLDVDGATNDSAALVQYEPPIIQVSDPGGVFAQYRSWIQGSPWQVTGYATLRNLLNDTSVTNLDSSGLPFGPGDFTGGFDYSIGLPPSASMPITVRFAVDATMTCDGSPSGVFCDGFESGDGSVWSALSP